MAALFYYSCYFLRKDDEPTSLSLFSIKKIRNTIGAADFF